MTAKKLTVTVECEACQGTGLYEGFCEAKGEAVICLRCDGQGADLISYTPFTGRKAKKGVKSIRRSAGGFLPMNMGGTGPTMTYQEFKKAVEPFNLELDERGFVLDNGQV